jgi:hypothetical protein
MSLTQLAPDLVHGGSGSDKDQRISLFWEVPQQAWPQRATCLRPNGCDRFSRTRLDKSKPIARQNIRLDQEMAWAIFVSAELAFKVKTLVDPAL